MWSTITPFGSPVEPEVKIVYARSAGVCAVSGRVAVPVSKSLSTR